MIIDPWGTIIAEGDEQAGSISAAIDVETVNQVRSQIPVFDDRLPEFYK
jgi:predicted amidohydrolase